MDERFIMVFVVFFLFLVCLIMCLVIVCDSCSDVIRFWLSMVLIELLFIFKGFVIRIWWLVLIRILICLKVLIVVESRFVMVRCLCRFLVK